MNLYLTAFFSIFFVGFSSSTYADSNPLRTDRRLFNPQGEINTERSKCIQAAHMRAILCSEFAWLRYWVSCLLDSEMNPEQVTINLFDRDMSLLACSDMLDADKLECNRKYGEEVPIVPEEGGI